MEVGGSGMRETKRHKERRALKERKDNTQVGIVFPRLSLSGANTAGTGQGARGGTPIKFDDNLWQATANPKPEQSYPATGSICIDMCLCGK